MWDSVKNIFPQAQQVMLLFLDSGSLVSAWAPVIHMDARKDSMLHDFGVARMLLFQMIGKQRTR